MIHAVLAALLAAGFFCLPAAARKKTPVDVGLSFIVDASGSINKMEMQLQRLGYAGNMPNPYVHKATHCRFLRSFAVS